LLSDRSDDSQLTMADHIAAVCQSGFFQLRQLRLIRQSLTPVAVKTLVHAFISSRLDYCNQLFVGVSGRLSDKLKSLQNAAARLVTGARKFDRITPVMRELHWLPVRQRLQFKTVVLVFKCIHGQAPVYLSEYCKSTTENTGRSHLPSANTCLLSVPRTRTTCDRSFAVSGPATWNSLPVALRSSDAAETFRRHSCLTVLTISCIQL